jgi:hypothetical protein
MLQPFYKHIVRVITGDPPATTLNVGDVLGEHKFESSKTLDVRNAPCHSASNIESGGRGYDVAKGLQHFVLLLSIARIKLEF